MFRAEAYVINNSINPRRPDHLPYLLNLPLMNVIVLLNRLHISIASLCLYHMTVGSVGLIPYLLAVQLGLSDIDSFWVHCLAGEEI